MTDRILTSMESFVVPAWARIDAERGKTSACIQFHCKHMGLHEVWIGSLERFHGDPEVIAELALGEARVHYNTKWPGTGRDVRVTGGAFYTPQGWSQPVHIRDIP